MRIGVFGGSFDPIHVAHLIHAQACHEQAQLDRLLFVPAPRPPHKRDGAGASFGDRAAMVGLAIAGQNGWEVELCEANRPGPSYTVDTLRELNGRNPDATFHLIVGSDSVRDLGTWRDPQGIARLARLLIVQRPGAEVTAPPEYFTFLHIHSPLLEISSTVLRQRAAAGKSLRYFTPDAVCDHVTERGLYRS